MNDIQVDVRALTAEVAELKRQLEGRKDHVSGFTNSANLNINAGGVGVWVATTACIVMLAVSFFMAMWVLDLSAKVSELNQLLNAVYMMAPHLKPTD